MSLSASATGLIAEETDFSVPADRLFAALAGRPGSFFLDSAMPAGDLGAYSFIGFDPFLTVRAKGDQIIVTEDGIARERRGDPLAELRSLLRSFTGTAAPGLPFAGGAVGFFSYELCSRLERIRRTSPDDPGIPDLELGFYDGVLAFENASGRSWYVGQSVFRDSPEQIVRRLRETVAGAWSRRDPLPPHRAAAPRAAVPAANFSRPEYLRAVDRIKDYIAAGDVYQVNLAQRFETALAVPPYVLYERLRRQSPAPFAAYVNGADGQILSSSPERFLRIQGDRADTRPIKGTRPRGRTAAEDALLREDLLRSPKDRAELLMIVDLERNDLGRVCVPGSIRVDELFQLESHPTVHHLVAAISGRLRPGPMSSIACGPCFPEGRLPEPRRCGRCRSSTNSSLAAATAIPGRSATSVSMATAI